MENKENWNEIGDLSKRIRNELVELLKLSQEIGMRKKETDAIIKTMKYLDNYRSKAENYMFLQGIKDFGVFYNGGNDE